MSLLSAQEWLNKEYPSSKGRGEGGLLNIHKSTLTGSLNINDLPI